MVILRPFVDKQTILNFAKRYPELDVASIETCLAFLHTTADVYQALDVHFARYGLSRGKFTLLMQLYLTDEKGLTPSECAQRADVTKATITGLLDGLERDGLVRRLPDVTDRRMLRLQLTDKGRDLLSQMLPDHFCRTTDLMGNLTDSEKKTLIKLLNKVRTGTSAMLDP
ncbi:transcriptional regulatory protein MarR family [Kalymmatonema gypsitolerans NIES-4073]|nr:transcriptional regulatory protein MarR family [Scytonema sp. NIES-4073]